MPEANESEPNAKLFTLEQANAMLPLVKAIVRDLSNLSKDVVDRRERLMALRENHPQKRDDIYQQELLQIEEELVKDAQRLRDYVEELQALGIEPKNGLEGIVDFRCLIDGHVAYLCWKLDEPEITHWHELDGGFAGRKPLPPEWLENRPAVKN
jgi:hypothetical protein